MAGGGANNTETLVKHKLLPGQASHVHNRKTKTRDCAGMATTPRPEGLLKVPRGLKFRGKYQHAMSKTERSSP